jgi:hypothetical protein
MSLFSEKELYWFLFEDSKAQLAAKEGGVRAEGESRATCICVTLPSNAGFSVGGDKNHSLSPCSTCMHRVTRRRQRAQLPNTTSANTAPCVWKDTPLIMPAKPKVSAGSSSSPSIGAGGKLRSSCSRMLGLGLPDAGVDALAARAPTHLLPLAAPCVAKHVPDHHDYTVQRQLSSDEGLYHVSFASAARCCGRMCCSM